MCAIYGVGCEALGRPLGGKRGAQDRQDLAVDPRPRPSGTVLVLLIVPVSP